MTWARGCLPRAPLFGVWFNVIGTERIDEDCQHPRVWHPDGTGTGTGKNWSQKKYQYQKIFVPEKSSSTRGFTGIWYWYRRIPGNFPYFEVVLEPVPEKNGPEKSTRTGSGKIWSRKKSIGTVNNSEHSHTLQHQSFVIIIMIDDQSQTHNDHQEIYLIVLFGARWSTCARELLAKTICYSQVVTLTIFTNE